MSTEAKKDTAGADGGLPMWNPSERPVERAVPAPPGTLTTLFGHWADPPDGDAG